MRGVGCSQAAPRPQPGARGRGGGPHRLAGAVAVLRGGPGERLGPRELPGLNLLHVLHLLRLSLRGLGGSGGVGSSGRGGGEIGGCAGAAEGCPAAGEVEGDGEMGGGAHVLQELLVAVDGDAGALALRLAAERLGERLRAEDLDAARLALGGRGGRKAARSDEGWGVCAGAAEGVCPDTLGAARRR